MNITFQINSPCPANMSLEGSLLYLPGPGGEQSWRDMAQALRYQVYTYNYCGRSIYHMYQPIAVDVY